MDFPIGNTFSVNQISDKPLTPKTRVKGQKDDEFIRNSGNQTEDSSLKIQKPVPRVVYNPVPTSSQDIKTHQSPEVRISKLADAIQAEIKEHIGEAKDVTDKYFGDLIGETGVITARVKDKDSIISKLENKLEIVLDKLDKNESCTEICKIALGDGYGTRIQLEPLSNETARETVENAGLDYDSFVADIQDYIKSGKELPENYKEVITKLKTLHAQPIVDRLIDLSGKDNYKITEINNYGDDITSYFTYGQVKSIAYAINNPDFSIITKADDPDVLNKQTIIDPETGEVSFSMTNDSGDVVGKLNTENAIKKSGYSSCQFNIEYTFKDNTKGFGELQIRSTKLNKFADAEHIPYDIRKGKIKETDTEYAPIYKLVKGMNKDSYKKYNQYLTSVYQSIRMQELGFEDVKIPDLNGNFYYENGTMIDKNDMAQLTYDNLIEYKSKVKSK